MWSVLSCARSQVTGTGQSKKNSKSERSRTVAGCRAFVRKMASRATVRSTATRAARPAAATTSVPNRAATKRRFLVPLVRAGGSTCPASLRWPQPRAESRHGHEGERSDSNPIEHHSGPLSPHSRARMSLSLSLHHFLLFFVCSTNKRRSLPKDAVHHVRGEDRAGALGEAPRAEGAAPSAASTPKRYKQYTNTWTRSL